MCLNQERCDKVNSAMRLSKFAEKLAKHAVTNANGTAALSCLHDFCFGDEVLAPSFTFIATGSVVSAEEAGFCDVDPRLSDGLDDAKRRLQIELKLFRLSIFW